MYLSVHNHAYYNYSKRYILVFIHTGTMFPLDLVLVELRQRVFLKELKLTEVQRIGSMVLMMV